MGVSSPQAPWDLSLSGRLVIGAEAAVTAPASPHSRQRSGRIPALPYPLRERS